MTHSTRAAGARGTDTRASGARTGRTRRWSGPASFAAALALVLPLAACGAQGDGPPVPGDGAAAERTAAASSGTAAAHGEADVRFAHGMIAHHEGALKMSELAIVATDDPEIRALAEAIRAAQGPEIEQMSRWLTAWGEEDVAASGMEGMHHGATEGGTGTDMEAGMERLGELSGREFDRAFLELMIEHHRDAVVMARTQVDEGADPEALALAERIIADQTEEIARMETMLEDL